MSSGGRKDDLKMHDELIGAALPTTAALAYLGDARHALYVRRMLVERGICKSGELNEASLSYVTAEAQARMMRRMQSSLPIKYQSFAFLRIVKKK